MRPLWWLTLSKKIAISPYLWQMEFSGASLANFPLHREGDYIKLLLPRDSSTSIFDVDPQAPDLSGLFKRSYTVCSFDQREKILTIYVTRHKATTGPAASWANSVQPGDDVLITGPGPVDQVDPHASRFLMAGDLPSLGAVLANLRRLPKTAQGDLVFEAPEPLALIEQSCPQGIEVHWIKSETDRSSPLFVETVKQLPAPDEKTCLWVACEYSSMKRLREYFSGELGLTKQQFYLSSYYKFGATDEQHKQTRREEGYKD